MVVDHQADRGSQWPAIRSIAARIGGTAETLRRQVRNGERDFGLRLRVTSDARDRVQRLEREVRELREADEILRKAWAYSACAELECRSRP